MHLPINGGRPIEILLVEDTATEAELTMETLADGRVRNRVHWVENGEEAIAFLARQGRYASVPKPDLILLDLHMPRKDGFEVLAEVKQHPDWKRIPVVVMTSSASEKHMLEAYNLHANCYITKPIDIDQFISAVRSIEEFWLTVVRLPAA